MQEFSMSFRAWCSGPRSRIKPALNWLYRYICCNGLQGFLETAWAGTAEASQKAGRGQLRAWDFLVPQCTKKWGIRWQPSQTLPPRAMPATNAYWIIPHGKQALALRLLSRYGAWLSSPQMLGYRWVGEKPGLPTGSFKPLLRSSHSSPRSHSLIIFLVHTRQSLLAGGRKAISQCNREAFLSSIGTKLKRSPSFPGDRYRGARSSTAELLHPPTASDRKHLLRRHAGSHSKNGVVLPGWFLHVFSSYY